MAMTLISSQTLSSSAASVTFSSIPQTFKSLRLVVSARGMTDMAIAFNGTTASVSVRALYGNGSGAGSASLNNWAGYAGQTGYTANTFGNTEICIPNYSGSGNKPYSVDGVTENNATSSYLAFGGGLWANTAAITSITLSEYNGSTSFVSGSSFYLYGIK